MHQSQNNSAPSFAFLHKVDSPNSLAMKNQLDVGTLSRRITRICIHTITAWLLLFPTSQTRTAIGMSRDKLSCVSRSNTGFPRSAKISMLG
jgi:hypothetical protein